MCRTLNALQEWLQLRTRLRQEHRFHLDRAAADFESLGLSSRVARRAARERFGTRHNLRLALREIGGDWAGLAHLLRAHRVLASVWLQPAVLLAAIAAILLLSPAPRNILESMAGKALTLDSPQTVFLSVGAPWPSFNGITAPEFEALRSLPTLTAVERYRAIYVRATANGASLAAVEADARARTGNPGIRAVSQFEQRRIGMGPAAVAWALIAIFAFFSVRPHSSPFGGLRWLAYAVFAGALHALASLTAWAFAIEIWSRIAWPTHLSAALCFPLIYVAYLLSIAVQCRYWQRDLYHRCPICLERMLLTSTHGATDSVLLSMAVTESICAHGHGVLIESRWVRQFRQETSPLEALIRG
jgi:hypothetical protein